MNTNTLIENHLALANKLALDKKKKLPSVAYEELQSAAYYGLTEAANRFKPELGFAFSTYAYHKISSAINDYLRELGLKIETISDSMKESISTRNKEFGIFKFVEESLGEDALQIIKFYFLYQFSMKEIGERLNITEGRVCQLISGYKKNIKEKLLAA